MAIWLYRRGGAHSVGVPSYAQKMPVAVCSLVRRVRVTMPSPPSAFTSANASAYSKELSAGGGGTPDLKVSAAASLKSPLTAYANAFTAAHVRLSFGGSDVLAAQIRQGARADVYAAANAALADALYAQRLVERRKISETLKECDYNKSRAAERLSVSYKTLLTRIKELELE